MTQPYPLTGTLLTPSTRKRLPQRLRSNALVSTNGSLPASRVLGTDPLGAHLDYDRIADQPSRIIDETNCESCNGSSFAESRSNEGTQSWLPKDTTDVYTYTVRPEAPASGCKMGNSSHRFFDLFAIGSSEDRPDARGANQKQTPNRDRRRERRTSSHICTQTPDPRHEFIYMLQ